MREMRKNKKKENSYGSANQRARKMRLHRTLRDTVLEV
jgi:hypothetical protein